MYDGNITLVTNKNFGGRHMESDIRAINEQIIKLEGNLKRDRDMLISERVSVMRYLWPFIAVAVFVTIAGYIIGSIWTFIKLSTGELPAGTNNTMVVTAISLAIAIVIFVVGYLISRHLANKKNSVLDDEEQFRRSDIKKCSDKLIELKTIRMLLQSGREPKESCAFGSKTEAEEQSLSPDMPDDKKEELIKIESAAQECQNRLKQELLQLRVSKATFFRFFWPFPVLAFVLFTTYPLYSALLSGYLRGAYFFSLPSLYHILPVAAFGLILLPGSIYAGNKRDKFNQKFCEEEKARCESVFSLQEDIAALTLKKNEILDMYTGASAPSGS